MHRAHHMLAFGSFAFLPPLLLTLSCGGFTSEIDSDEWTDSQEEAAKSRSVKLYQNGPAELRARPSERISITYNWSGGPTSKSLINFIHFVNAEGATIYQDDHWPSVPTNQWSKNPWSEVREYVVPQDAPVGTLRVFAGLHDGGPGGSGARLKLKKGAAVIEDAASPRRYLVGTVVIDPPVVTGGTLAPCRADAALRLVSTAPLFALPGSLFSTTLYSQTDPNRGSWVPAKIRALVTDAAGNAISGCQVGWTPGPNAGWFFPDADRTDGTGQVGGWWVAGTANPARVEARIARQGQPDSTVMFEGAVSAQPHRNLTPAAYLGFTTPQWQAYRLDVTPVTDPNFTYYQVVGWEGAYTGLQRADDLGGKLLILTVWNANGVQPAIVNAPASSRCRTASGPEGDTIQCLFPYSWKAGQTYRFEVHAAHVVAGTTDYSLSVTDLGAMATLHVATIRYGRQLWPSSPGTFLEQFAGDQMSCLASEQRMVYWSNVSYQPVGSTAWQPVTEATFSRPYDPTYGHGSLCFNYDRGVENGRFFTSAGGSRVGRPCSAAEVGEPCSVLRVR